MARPSQDAIKTYISITGASEAVAFQKLEEFGGDLNEAINAHFSEGDTNSTHPTSIPATQNNFVAIDDPVQVETEGPRLPLFSAERTRLNPFSLLDPDFARRFRGRSPESSTRTPFVSHPREVREIPIEFKGGNNQPGHSSRGPTIEDVTETEYGNAPGIHGNVIIDNEDDEDISTAPTAQVAERIERNDGFSGDSLHGRHLRPSAPELDSASAGTELEDEMIQAAIEASKREIEVGHPNQQFDAPYDSYSHEPQSTESNLEDAELARAVSLSLKTAEQEKAMRELLRRVEAADQPGFNPPDLEELGQRTAAHGRQEFGSFDRGIYRQFKPEVGSSSIQDKVDNVEEQLHVRHKSNRAYSESMEDTPPSSSGTPDVCNHPPNDSDAFRSDEWGGISSKEHDEALVLEAAFFGGIPEGTGHHTAHARHQLMQAGLDRNDNEYLAALQADREKELKAKEEVDARCMEQRKAWEDSLKREQKKEEESHRKLLQEQKFERSLATKEASLPQEPTSDVNAVNLLVRMPDGRRCGRCFLKSDKLQCLFDFIDTTRVVKPGSYKLVRPFPRRAFSESESKLSLSELGLTSKQEALFLELI